MYVSYIPTHPTAPTSGLRFDETTTPEQAEAMIPQIRGLFGGV